MIPYVKKKKKKNTAVVFDFNLSEICLLVFCLPGISMPTDICTLIMGTVSAQTRRNIVTQNVDYTFPSYSMHILQQYLCVLPVYTRTGDTECYAQVNGGPVRSCFSTVTALAVPGYSLHLVQGFTVLLLSNTEIHTAS